MAIELEFDESEHDGWRVLAVRGEIDAYTSPRLREELKRLIDGGSRRLVVDLQGVEFMDSTGLGVLVSALKRIKEPGASSDASTGSNAETASNGSSGEMGDGDAQGSASDGRLSLVCTSPQILRVLAVTGLDKVFVVAPSVAEATAA
jgi:anti-sigma B factor antagonist